MKMYYIYLTTNLINNKKYIGMHHGELNDDYLGSGNSITEAIKKYSDLFFHIDTDVTNPVMLSLPYIIYIHLIMIYKSWTYDHGSDYPFGRQEPSHGILTKIYSIK